MNNTKSADLPISCCAGFGWDRAHMLLHLRLQVNLQPWCASVPRFEQRRPRDSGFDANLINGRNAFVVSMYAQTLSISN